MPDLDPGALLHQLMEPLRREIALAQEIIERERKLTSQLVAPVDAVFDLLQETGAMLERQAEALEAAGAAITETAALVRGQAELFERTVGTLRLPVDLAKSAARVEKKAPRRSSSSRQRAS